MDAVVVDASAVAAVVFAEPDQARMIAALDGRNLCAPRLLELELASVACTKLRKRDGTPEALIADFNDVGRLGIVLLDPPVDDVLALALTSGLTPYDASYLWLALALGVPLVTLDKQLARAAKRLGGGGVEL